MQNVVLMFWYVVGTVIINNMIKLHDNIPHIKGVIATRVKHECTGKLGSFHHGWWWPLALQSPLTRMSACAYTAWADIRYVLHNIPGGSFQLQGFLVSIVKMKLHLQYVQCDSNNLVSQGGASDIGTMYLLDVMSQWFRQLFVWQPTLDRVGRLTT